MTHDIDCLIFVNKGCDCSAYASGHTDSPAEARAALAAIGKRPLWDEPASTLDEVQQ